MTYYGQCKCDMKITYNTDDDKRAIIKYQCSRCKNLIILRKEKNDEK